MKATPAFEFHLRELLTVVSYTATLDATGSNDAPSQPDAATRTTEFLTRYSRLPVELNGFPVIAILPRERPPMADKTTKLSGPPSDYVVVVQREDDNRMDGKHAPFVVARWAPSCGDSWDHGAYVATLAEAMTIAIERSAIHTGAKLPTPHDKSSAPPQGFTRYQIELDAPNDVDSSYLLERAQDFATDLIELVSEDEREDEPEEMLSERISERVSVQLMEG